MLASKAKFWRGLLLLLPLIELIKVNIYQRFSTKAKQGMFCHLANSFKKSSNNCVQLRKFLTDEMAKNSFTLPPDL